VGQIKTERDEIEAVKCINRETLHFISRGFRLLKNVEMVDVEEGELVEQEQKQKQHESKRNVSGQNGVVEADNKKQEKQKKGFRNKRRD